MAGLQKGKNQIGNSQIELKSDSIQVNIATSKTIECSVIGEMQSDLNLASILDLFCQ